MVAAKFHSDKEFLYVGCSDLRGEAVKDKCPNESDYSVATGADSTK